MAHKLKCWVKRKEPYFAIHLPYSESFESKKGDVVDVFKTYEFTKIGVYVTPNKGKTHRIYEGYNKLEALDTAKSYMKKHDRC